MISRQETIDFRKYLGIFVYQENFYNSSGYFYHKQDM